MAQLIVRNLDEVLVRRLKVLAAEHGVSAEEEHRRILRQALEPQPTPGWKQLLASIPDVGGDEDFTRDDDLGRSVTW